MSTERNLRPVTTLRLAEMKSRGEKIAMLTAYDYSMARILDRAGIDVILVGDSAANVMAGYETTVPMTLDNMIYHAQSVTRAVERALVVVDMPFGTYQGNSKEALCSAVRIMKETEAGAVKLEGGKEILESVDRILSAGIPVMGHLGLTPQSIHKYGTYAVRAKEEAEAELLFVEGENKAKEQYRRSLDSEIAEKEKQLKDERKAKVDSILDSVGSLVGVGKSAAVEKENAKLKAENERMKKAFVDAVKDKADERTKALVAEKQKAEAERDRALVQSRSLAVERDKAVWQVQEQKDGERQRISQAVSHATAEKDKTIRLLQGTLKASRHILSLFADMLYKASEIFKRAIDAIIHFGTEQHKSFFAPSEAADIKSVMQEYGETTEQQNMVGAWLCDYAESRQSFDKIKHRHTLKEVSDVAEGRYDWKIEQMQRNNISM